MTLSVVLVTSIIQLLIHQKKYRNFAKRVMNNNEDSVALEKRLKRIDFRCKSWRNFSIGSGGLLTLWLFAWFVYDTHIFPPQRAPSVRVAPQQHGQIVPQGSPRAISMAEAAAQYQRLQALCDAEADSITRRRLLRAVRTLVPLFGTHR